MEIQDQDAFSKDWWIVIPNNTIIKGKIVEEVHAMSYIDRFGFKKALKRIQQAFTSQTHYCS